MGTRFDRRKLLIPLGVIAVLAATWFHRPPEKRARVVLTPSPKSVSNGPYKITIENVRECDFQTDTWTKIEPGDIALGVEVTVEATTDRSVRFSPDASHLTGPEGEHPRPFPKETGCEPRLHGRKEIEPGTPLRGWITFEVPERINWYELSLSVSAPSGPNRRRSGAIFKLH